MDDRTRVTANTLVGFYTVLFASADVSEQETAFVTTGENLNMSEAISVANNDVDLALDYTRLLEATSTTYSWLFERLSSSSAKSEEELVFDLRTFIDGLVEE
jgi:hypothetical protein